MDISEETWHEMVDRAFESMPEPHRSAVQNIAIVLEDDPTEEQRHELELRYNQTLLGLYSGVALIRRQGHTNLYPPDVITLFKNPLLLASGDQAELFENVRHTLWHELAHYFGLDHDQIDKLQ